MESLLQGRSQRTVVLLWHLGASSSLVCSLPAESIWDARLDRLFVVMVSGSMRSAEGPLGHDCILRYGASELALGGLQAM